MGASDGISREVSAIWEEMVGGDGQGDPTETLIPQDIPTYHGSDSGTTEDPVLNRATVSSRTNRVPTPMPSPSAELADATRNYHEFNRRYRLHRVLGEGGMGAVYLARQHALAREVAVKVLRGDDTQVMRKQLLFRAEALVTAHLEHPNIIPVYDAADHCLVMKHVRGETMDAVIAGDRSRAALARNVEILVKACDAIRFAHSRGIIHRDIKAKNVMVGEYGEVLVLDWGLALAIAIGPDGDFHAPRLDHCPHVCAGTPGCLPPEIARSERGRVGMHSDLFMLGALLYHILTGELPFHHRTAMESLIAAAANRYDPLDRSALDAPIRLIDTCERAMASDPAQRGSVEDFVDGLRRWLLTAGNEEIAAREAEEARELMAVADAHATAGDERRARSCRLAAVDHLERAVRFLPDSEGLSSLHDRCLSCLPKGDGGKRPRAWWKVFG